MSDVSTTVDFAAQTVQPVVESSGSIWGYVVGGIVIVIAAGYFVFRKINKPAFMIKQLRKRNQKEMKKNGVESAEAMNDLDLVLDAVEAYATEKKMKGTEMVKLLAPLNDADKIKSASDFYHAMSYIAKSIDNQALAKNLLNKSKQVKSSSALMAGLLKRAGI
ncbi:hypothetical protein ACUULL_000034 [Vibrio cholerae]|uniref:DUF4381 domain-containing protein n=1 Tax=Vibrio paracholerae TaxID=650003 RepID=A0ABD7FUQ2_9VIBR|nr:MULTISPECIES: hypothetical protein [Vibrio]EJL6266803.1 hypothetical protein [Vibrio cholerae]EJL6280534.1 hypothetical protein [Vibrio cholerae]EJX9123496.1 hypothetical protein [Vibrio cholerae]EJY0786298.1 hypothetical protein [Vibrio cholerae]EKF9485892.1 hypothetical protein [Vibrio cholerae]